MRDTYAFKGAALTKKVRIDMNKIKKLTPNKGPVTHYTDYS